MGDEFNVGRRTERKCLEKMGRKQYFYKKKKTQ